MIVSFLRFALLFVCFYGVLTHLCEKLDKIDSQMSESVTPNIIKVRFSD